MAVSRASGPLIVTGNTQSVIPGQPPADYNQDAGASGFFAGIMLLDPRNQAGGVNGGWFASDIVGVNAAPATLATANIAALANVTNGTPMTLVAATGAGITVATAALQNPLTGQTFLATARFIDGAPAWVSYGTAGNVAAYDPRTTIARAVSITGVASGTGGAFTVRGADLYGYPVTEVITVGAGVNTVNGKKGLKAVYSVTPGFTDAHNYSVGTTDIFEFVIATYDFGQVTICWANGFITAATGFVAADTNNPTGTTGSVRGTYAVQSASNGSNKLITVIMPMPYAALAINGNPSLLGNVNFAG